MEFPFGLGLDPGPHLKPYIGFLCDLCGPGLNHVRSLSILLVLSFRFRYLSTFTRLRANAGICHLCKYLAHLMIPF
jgi:hypothetical protein